MRKKQNGSATIILIILLIAVIMAVTVAIVIFLTDKKDGGNVEKPQNTVQTLPVQVTEDEYYQPTDEEKAKNVELMNKIRANIPVMDGSTSTSSIQGGIKSSMLGLSEKIAEAGTTHSSTNTAFNNLLEGNNDIIFTTTLSEEQQNKAQEKNIELRIEAISYEGLVFIVNANNPVDTLTQEQIKDIYSGKITNWKDVGGNDATIVVYKRNDDSGVQNYMNEFMQDTKIKNTSNEMTQSSDESIIQAITTKENGDNAIGYSVYTYINNMYTDRDKIKFIKIDGIEPTKESIVEQKYPLQNYNYAVYNKAKEEETAVDELVEWLLTYKGQETIKNAGHLPFSDVKTQEYNYIPCTTLGTGIERTTEKSDDFYYTLHTTEYYLAGQNATILGIQALNNRELQSTINTFVRESREQLEQKMSEYETYVNELSDAYSTDGITVRINCKNGYLSVEVLLTYIKEGIEEKYVYDGMSKVYDLYTGNELALSDLYYKDTDFLAAINNTIEKIVLGAIETDYIKVKDFDSSSMTDITIFGLDTITFTKDNPYFKDGVTIKIDTYFDNLSVINKERDMEGLWEEGTEITKTTEIHTINEPLITDLQNCNYKTYYIDTNNEIGDYTVNQFIKRYVDNEQITTLLKQAMKKNGNTKYILNEQNQYQIIIEHTILGNKYATIVLSANPKANSVELGKATVNLETGEGVKQSEIQQWKTQNGVTE